MAKLYEIIRKQGKRPLHVFPYDDDAAKSLCNAFAKDFCDRTYAVKMTAAQARKEAAKYKTMCVQCKVAI